MKINRVSCTQFAGVRDRDISLADGINVVYGKNESGKSTIVNLLSRTLFQKAKLDRRSDKEFWERYFPGEKRGSSVKGDFADGKVTIETASGTYTLSKEWGADARCTLSTPDGMIRDQKTIDGILKGILLYGEGVYTDILFPSQNNTDMSLRTILDASSKTDAKQEITDVMSQAFAESDGISMNAIEQAITEKIDEIAGKHWDFEREIPARKAGRWANGLGEILKAYYALEDAQKVLGEISRLESEADLAANDYTTQDTAAHIAEDEYNRFYGFASRLAVQAGCKKECSRIEEDISKTADALDKWPKLSDDLNKAKALQEEQQQRELLTQYESAQKIAEELNSLNAEFLDRACPSNDEIAQVKKAQKQIATLENKLCGMNIAAAVELLGENTIEITSLRTGEAINLTDGMASLTEAVKISLPGIMEMQLSPANVNVSDVEDKIAEYRSSVNEVFAKYQVDSLDNLNELAESIREGNAKICSANSQLSAILGSRSYENLVKAAQAINTDVRSKEKIEQDILAVCGTIDVAKFITVKETIIAGYVSEYNSIDDLKTKAAELEEVHKGLVSSLSDTEDIPAEYLCISEPEAFLTQLQADLRNKRKLRETALTNKTAAVSKLESYRENTSGDPVANAEKAERLFNEKKELLAHWRHIAEVFKMQKEAIRNNPMQDLSDRFVHYLNVISGGKVSSEFPETDKLNMNIYSDNNLLDYGKLSEGTKETVSLAFRLAVLDHLFPNGGGVIVFDDPFTDMDEERTAQSCELIKECAKQHQVIFLTCCEDYLSMLPGNEIRV